MGKQPTPEKIYTNLILVFAVALLTAMFFCLGGQAQSLGDPIVKITFGAGTATHAGALAADSGSTSYTYTSADFPIDGSYTIENTTNTPNIWWTTTDHTGNAGGYFMVVNASVAKTDYFYQRTITGLCGATQYQFSAWVGNLLRYSDLSPPDIIFGLYNTDGTLIQSYDTGPIAQRTSGFLWIQQKFNFTLPAGVTSLIIKMTNNANGGAPANDLALDDISFSPYGSQVSAVFSSSATSQSLCAGTSQTISVNATTTLAASYVQKLQMLVNGVWTDESQASTATSFSIASPTVAGTYYYRLASAYNTNIGSAECVVASNQLTLTVLPTPVSAFTVADTTCLGNNTIFTDQSTASGGTIASWAWNFGDGTTSAVQNPTHTYTSAGNYTVTLTTTNNSGCGPSTVSQTIHIATPPVAAFSYSSPDCVTKAVTLTDQSTAAEGTITSWLWDYGDGTTETKLTNAAFAHTYAATGPYTIRLVVTGNKGSCPASVSHSVTINPLPVVNFITPEVCVNDLLSTFTDSTTIADNSNAGFTYLWNFGDPGATVSNPNTSTLKNPSHHYTAAAVYQVSLTVTSGNGCTSTATKSFTVNGATPIAVFTPSQTSFCSDREVFFTNKSTVDFGNVTKVVIYYDAANNPTVSETDNNPYFGKIYGHTYPSFQTPATVTYKVRMVAYSGSATSCSSEADNTITLLAVPTLSFSALSAICNNKGAVQLVAAPASSSAGTGIFTGMGVGSTGLFDPSVSGVGTFIINYIYTSANGCTDTTSQSITVNGTPTVKAGPAITLLQGTSAVIQATASVSTGETLTYLWSPATDLSSATVLNPIVTPTADRVYTLTATTPEGCQDTSSVSVTLLKIPIIPNTFTPNGDGINDTWQIEYLDEYPQCKVEIFNRSGQRVYYSIGYQAPWNGTYNGSVLAVGAYYYVINPMRGQKVLAGSVQIIR